MIERFNFFDVYGYLLPGALLLGLGWLPIGIVAGAWPPAEIELALIGGIASYFLGHLLHMAVRHFFTVTENGKYPHDFLLDQADTTFTPALKRLIADRIRERFGIEVNEDGDIANGDLTRRRFDAFQLCRRWLIQEKTGSYAEQFQGLYELRRGLAAGCLANMSLYFGWALGSFSPLLGSKQYDQGAVFVLMVIAGVVSLFFPKRLFWFLAVILWGAGFIAGGWLEISGRQGILLAFLGLVLAWVGWQLRSSIRSFTREFAATVYRDFFVLATTDVGQSPKNRSNQGGALLR